MQKLVFINGTGTQIDLTSGNFGITNWAGLSNTGLNIQTQQVPFEDGGVFLDALMEQREIEVTVAIYDGNNLELRYQKKRELISALNPKLGEGTLIYTNDYLSRQIKAVPQIPLFENKNSNDAGTLKASVAFSCCSPYWEDVELTETDFNYYKQPILENNGDVSIGIEAELKLLQATNIRIKNKTTNKQIDIIGNFNKSIYINTKTGEKGIYEENIITKDINITSKITSIYVENNRILFGTFQGYIGYTDDNFKSCVIIKQITTRRIDTIIKHNDKYYFGGGFENVNTQVFTSTDLEVFTPLDVYGKIYYIERTNVFVVVSGYLLFASTDGETFTQVYNGSGSAGINWFNSIIDTGTLIFASANGTGRWGVSSDGENWGVQNAPSNITNEFCIYKDYLYITTNGNTIRAPLNTLSYENTNLVGTKIFVDSRGFIFTSGGYFSQNGIDVHQNTELSGNLFSVYYNTEEKSVLLFYVNSIKQTTDYTDFKTIKGNYIGFDFATKTKGKFICAQNSSPNIRNVIYESGDDNCDFIESSAGVYNAKELISDMGSQIILIGDNETMSSIDNGITYTLENRGGLGGIYVKELKKFFIYSRQYIYEIKDGVIGEVHYIPSYSFPYVGIRCIYCKNYLYLSGKGQRLLKVNVNNYTYEYIDTNINTNFSDFIYVPQKESFFACNEGDLYYSTNLTTWTLVESYNSNVKKIINMKKWGMIFLFLENGDIYRFVENSTIQLFKQIDLNCKSVTNDENSIYYFNDFQLLKFEFEKGDNIINNLSAKSNMDLKLIQGENQISVSTDAGEINVIIKYRQKYIGV